MAKPTETYTWSLGPGEFPVSAPSVGQRTVGWAAGDYPPAEEINWLYRANGNWLTYIDDIFVDVPTTLPVGGPRTTPGISLSSVTMGVESEPVSGLGSSVFSFSASSLSCTVVSDLFRVRGRYTFNGGGLLGEGALRLNPSRSPALAGPGAFHDWQMETGNGGKVVVAQGAVVVDATPAEVVAQGVGRDECLNTGNLVKGACRIRVVRTAGAVTTCALEGVAYNISGVSFTGSSFVQFTITDHSAGGIQGVAIVHAQHTGLINNVARPLALSPSVNVGTGVVTMGAQVQNTSTDVWWPLDASPGASGIGDLSIDIFVTIY